MLQECDELDNRDSIWKVVQAALVIRWFAIRGFDYSRMAISDPNLVSAAFLSIIRKF